MSCITYDILGRLDRQTTKPTTVMPPTNTLRNTKRSIIIITIIRFVANVCALGGFTWKMLRRRSRDTAVGMQLVATATNAIVAVVLFHFSLPLVSLLFVLFVFFFFRSLPRFFSSQTICSLATRPQSRSRDQTTRIKTTDDISRITK